MTDLNMTASRAAPYCLAIDAMGGDQAPEIVLAGLDRAADRHPAAKILLVGDEALLRPQLARFPKAQRICDIRHAPTSISMEMKPTAALRLRDSSLRMAIDAVASGEAGGVVSAGNSGAMLALAKIVLKTCRGSPVLRWPPLIRRLVATWSCWIWAPILPAIREISLNLP